MPDEPNTKADARGPAIYEIRIEGHLGRQWEDWFDGMTIVTDTCGNTVLTGRVVDQAALYSLLRKIRDLGKPLLSVTRVEPE